LCYCFVVLHTTRCPSWEKSCGRCSDGTNARILGRTSTMGATGPKMPDPHVAWCSSVPVFPNITACYASSFISSPNDMNAMKDHDVPNSDLSAHKMLPFLLPRSSPTSPHTGLTATPGNQRGTDKLAIWLIPRCCTRCLAFIPSGQA
jgi:hypothetical protein